MIAISDRKQVKDKEYFVVHIGGTKIFDCKVVEGKNGPFVSGPARSYVDKQGDTKYLNMVRFSDEDSLEILKALRASEVPEIDVDSDIPF